MLGLKVYLLRKEKSTGEQKRKYTGNAERLHLISFYFTAFSIP
jgi:hypothetical protein